MKQGRSVKIFVLSSLLIGVIFLGVTSIKILKTAGDLAYFLLDAQMYNAQALKTDQMTTQHKEIQKMRQEIYRSDDIIIRTYSNANALVKIIGLILALACWTAVPFSALRMLFMEISKKNEVKARREHLKWKLQREKQLPLEEEMSSETDLS